MSSQIHYSIGNDHLITVTPHANSEDGKSYLVAVTIIARGTTEQKKVKIPITNDTLAHVLMYFFNARSPNVKTDLRVIPLELSKLLPEWFTSSYPKKAPYRVATCIEYGTIFVDDDHKGGKFQDTFSENHPIQYVGTTQQDDISPAHVYILVPLSTIMSADSNKPIYKFIISYKTKNNKYVNIASNSDDRLSYLVDFSSEHMTVFKFENLLIDLSQFDELIMSGVKFPKIDTTCDTIDAIQNIMKKTGASSRRPNPPAISASDKKRAHDDKEEEGNPKSGSAVKKRKDSASTSAAQPKKRTATLRDEATEKQTPAPLPPASSLKKAPAHTQMLISDDDVDADEEAPSPPQKSSNKKKRKANMVVSDDEDAYKETPPRVPAASPPQKKKASTTKKGAPFTRNEDDEDEVPHQTQRRSNEAGKSETTSNSRKKTVSESDSDSQ